MQAVLSLLSGKTRKIAPPSPPLSKDEVLNDIGRNMSIGNQTLGVTVSYLIHYDSLLQNATYIITKCHSYFDAKCDRSLLQNGSGFLLQNVTALIKKCGFSENAAILLRGRRGVGWGGQYQFLRKITTHLPYFHLLTVFSHLLTIPLLARRINQSHLLLEK